MGYTYGTKWNDEIIIDELKKIIELHDLKTMPTRSEVIKYHSNALSCAITKRKGFKKTFSCFFGQYQSYGVALSFFISFNNI